MNCRDDKESFEMIVRAKNALMNMAIFSWCAVEAARHISLGISSLIINERHSRFVADRCVKGY